MMRNRIRAINRVGLIPEPMLRSARRMVLLAADLASHPVHARSCANALHASEQLRRQYEGAPADDPEMSPGVEAALVGRTG